MAKARLVIVDGPDLGREFQLAGTMAIGRDATAGIVLDDAEVSRRHSIVTWQDDAVMVEDLGSRNGTIVNGERITGAREVRAGDRIRIGETVLELRSNDAARTRYPGLSGGTPAAT